MNIYYKCLSLYTNVHDNICNNKDSLVHYNNLIYAFINLLISKNYNKIFIIDTILYRWIYDISARNKDFHSNFLQFNNKIALLLYEELNYNVGANNIITKYESLENLIQIVNYYTNETGFLYNHIYLICKLKSLLSYNLHNNIFKSNPFTQINITANYNINKLFTFKLKSNDYISYLDKILNNYKYINNSMESKCNAINTENSLKYININYAVNFNIDKNYLDSFSIKKKDENSKDGNMKDENSKDGNIINYKISNIAKYYIYIIIAITQHYYFNINLFKNEINKLNLKNKCKNATTTIYNKTTYNITITFYLLKNNIIGYPYNISFIEQIYEHITPLIDNYKRYYSLQNIPLSLQVKFESLPFCKYNLVSLDNKILPTNNYFTDNYFTDNYFTNKFNITIPYLDKFYSIQNILNKISITNIIDFMIENNIIGKSNIKAITNLKQILDIENIKNGNNKHYNYIEKIYKMSIL
jgi:hypothetical protein